jgi:glycosyltransferase involved in cell wall biosynthesis
MDEPGRLLFMTAFRFPDGDAMSNRLLQLARSACPPGTCALVVNDWPGDRPPATPPAVLPDNVELLTLRATGRSRAARHLARLNRPLRVVRALRDHGVGRDDIAAVCLPNGVLSLTTWLVLRTVLRRPIIVDVAERHDPAQFPRGRLEPHFVRHRWAMFLAATLADRVIVVSSHLQRHFEQRGAPVMVVPPQVDCDVFTAPSPPAPSPPALDTRLRLLYAGTPGSKDMLEVLAEGLRRLPLHDRARIELVIAGLDRAQAVGRSDLRPLSLNALGDAVTFLGRIPRAAVLDELSRSHFSVLIRPTGGYADAGFPSKVPESLAAGCPVLLNHTSDLARYVRDGVEGIVLGGSTADDVLRGLRRALALDDVAWRRMSDAARSRARESFDYRAWPAVAGFIVPSWARAGAAASRES